MFQAIDGLPDHVVALRAVGKVTGEDYHAVLEPAVARATAGDAKARLLMVLGADFEGYDLGAVAADAGVGLGHMGSFERIAVVTDEGWVQHAIGLFGRMIPGEVRLFPDAEEAAARTWIAA